MRGLLRIPNLLASTQMDAAYRGERVERFEGFHLREVAVQGDAFVADHDERVDVTCVLDDQRVAVAAADHRLTRRRTVDEPGREHGPPQRPGYEVRAQLLEDERGFDRAETAAAGILREQQRE